MCESNQASQVDQAQNKRTNQRPEPSLIPFFIHARHGQKKPKKKPKKKKNKKKKQVSK